MKEDKINWCFKKKGGLRLIEPNENLMKVYLKKARSALNMLESAVEKNETEWILDTSYYARYFSIYALFMKVGIKCEIHDCTITALNVLFVEPGLIPFEIYDELKEAKGLRIDYLYYNAEADEKVVKLFAGKTGDFCLKVEEIIDKFDAEMVSKVRRRFVSLRRGK